MLLFLMLMALPMTAANRILSPRFKTLTSTVNGDWLNHPVMQLNSNDVMTIGFDELSHNYHRLCYRIEHCEYDWTPSESLFDSDWLEGFNIPENSSLNMSFITALTLSEGKVVALLSK